MFYIPGYHLYRQDRSEKRGGGVCVWISSYLCSSYVQSNLIYDSPKSIECIWSKINDITLCACYIPPALSAADKNLINNYFIDSIDALKLTDPLTKIILAGDFNDFNVSDLLSHHCLNQIVKFPTRYAKTLDLILLDDRLTEYYNADCIQYPPLSSSDHNIIFLPCGEIAPPIERNICYYDLSTSNKHAYLSSLTNSNWSLVYNEPDINKKTDNFYFLLNSAINTIPKTYLKFTSRDKNWITPTCKFLINQRWKAYREGNFELFTYYKNKVKLEIQKCKSNVSNKIFRRKNNFWDVVKDIKSKDASNKLLKFSPDEINTYFQSIFIPQSLNLTVDHPVIQDNSNFTLLDINDVFCALGKVKSKCAGSDNIPSILLKIAAAELCRPLCNIYNSSLISCIVPTKWKVAKIIPVPKCKNPHINEFRPISLLPIASKILESLILKQMYHHLTNNYGMCQFGFRKGSNTTSALVSLYDDITILLEDSSIKALSVFSFDASKAFDTVNHSKLVSRLYDSNLPHCFSAWITSYLSNRSQYVYSNTNSSLAKVTSGVPQGAVLSPSLYCIFSSSLQVIHSSNKLYKYADDLILLVAHTSNTSDSIHCLDEINNIKSWCQTNDITLNINKTSRILVHKSKFTNFNFDYLNDICTASCSIKLLGVIFSNSLSWSPHIDSIVKKTSRNLFLLRFLKNYLNKTHLISIYLSLIASIIEFSCPLFLSSITNSDKLKIIKISKRAHSIICGFHCKNNCLPNPLDRMFKHSLNFFDKAQNPNNILHNKLPRTLPSGRFSVPYCNTSRRLNSFFPYMAITKNSQR